MLSRVLENAEFLFGGSFLLFSLSSDKIYAKAKIKVKFFDSLNFQQEIAIHLSNQYSTRLHKHSSDHQKHFYYRLTQFEATNIEEASEREFEFSIKDQELVTKMV